MLYYQSVMRGRHFASCGADTLRHAKQTLWVKRKKVSVDKNGRSMVR
jgi:hypothetical protein